MTSELFRCRLPVPVYICIVNRLRMRVHMVDYIILNFYDGRKIRIIIRKKLYFKITGTRFVWASTAGSIVLFVV